MNTDRCELKDESDTEPNIDTEAENEPVSVCLTTSFVDFCQLLIEQQTVERMTNYRILTVRVPLKDVIETRNTLLEQLLQRNDERPQLCKECRKRQQKVQKSVVWRSRGKWRKFKETRERVREAMIQQVHGNSKQKFTNNLQLWKGWRPKYKVVVKKCGALRKERKTKCQKNIDTFHINVERTREMIEYLQEGLDTILATAA